MHLFYRRQNDTPCVKSVSSLHSHYDAINICVTDIFASVDQNAVIFCYTASIKCKKKFEVS